MMVNTFNPLEDRRWPDFVRRHAGASVFHGVGWLDALSRTYGYQPVVYSTSPPGGELTNAVVLCLVDSWLTGRRLVSLPFTDHCEPLVSDPRDSHALCDALAGAIDNGSKKHRVGYVEIRPRSPNSWRDPAAVESNSYAFHVLDLRPALGEIFRRIHKNTLQRKIRRGEQSLTHEAGSTDALVRKFYRLLLLTRRRHKLPPQPMQWFQNLMTAMRDQLTIRVVSQGGRPLAAILTLSFRGTMVYKYGCSDARYHSTGAMPFLLWKTIEEAKATGMDTLDLGRSDPDNAGLITFKDRWGAVRSELTYYRYTHSRPSTIALNHRARVARRAFQFMPDSIFTATGRLLYRHLA